MTEKRARMTIRAGAAVFSVVALWAVPDVSPPLPVLNWRLPITLIPVDTIMIAPPKPRPPRTVASRPITAGTASLAPYLEPTEIPSDPSPIIVAEPSFEKPVVGLLSELFERPDVEPTTPRMEPYASPLPDILTTRSDEGPAAPPAALPGPRPQRGEVLRGSGSPDLDVATTPSYTGPRLDLPGTDIPSSGTTHGEVPSGTPAVGPGPGEKYESSVGSSPRGGTTPGLGSTGDLVDEPELSGLLSWLRQQRAAFPPVVRSYLETRSGDLCGVTRHAGWDIFIQFSPTDHQLKIFLSRERVGILLADSDFRQRSQYFGQGNVTRDATKTIVSIEAIRDKPAPSRTSEFYHVFGNWMDAGGIRMGSREAK